MNIMFVANCDCCEADKIVNYFRDENVFRINVGSVVGFEDFMKVFKARQSIVELTDLDAKTRELIKTNGL